jgi:hypothetical protein
VFWHPPADEVQESHPMTMTSDRAAHSTGPAESAGRTPIQWTSVQRGLWVGKSNGEFAGMIERRDDEGFVATTRLAQHLGVFATVNEAKASFAL